MAEERVEFLLLGDRAARQSGAGVIRRRHRGEPHREGASLFRDQVAYIAVTRYIHRAVMAADRLVLT
jgi:hypothetical protein